MEHGCLLSTIHPPPVIDPASSYDMPCRLLDSSQLLQHMPVFQPILLSGQQCRGRVAILVEVLGEAAFGLSEVAKVDLLAGLGIDVPILFNIRIADQAEALLKALAFARIVNEHR